MTADLLTLQNLSQDDVLDFTGYTIYQRGAQYEEDQSFQKIKIDPQTNVISATVIGNYGNYQTKAYIQKGQLKGRCNCPYEGSPCKHVAGLFRYWLKEGTSQNAPSTTSVSSPEVQQALEGAYHALSQDQKTFLAAMVMHPMLQMGMLDNWVYYAMYEKPPLFARRPSVKNIRQFSPFYKIHQSPAIEDIQVLFRLFQKEPFFAQLVQNIAEHSNNMFGYTAEWRIAELSESVFLKYVLFGLYSGNLKHLMAFLNLHQKYCSDAPSALDQIRGDVPLEEWIFSFDVSTQQTLLMVHFQQLFARMEAPTPELQQQVLPLLEDARFSQFTMVWSIYSFFQDPYSFRQAFADQPLPGELPVIDALIQGKDEVAYKTLQQVLKAYRQASGVHQKMLPQPFLLFQALLAPKFTSSLKMLSKALEKNTGENWVNSTGVKAVELWVTKCLGELEEAQAGLDVLLHAQSDMQVRQSPLDFMVLGWVLLWSGKDVPESYIQQLEACYQQAKKEGFVWAQFEFANILHHACDDVSQYELWLHESQNKDEPYVSVLSLYECQALWKQQLDALLQWSDNSANEADRIVWLVEYDRGELHVEPFQQHRLKSGGWGKRKAFRYYSGENLPGMTSQDVAALEILSNGYRYEKHVAALPLLAGHPKLFLRENPSIPVEIVSGDPEIWIEKKKNAYHVQFSLKDLNADVYVEAETPTRFKVIHVEERHRQIAKLLGSQTLKIPASEETLISQVSDRLSNHCTVHSSFQNTQQQLNNVDGDPTPHLLLLPYEEGVKANLFVRPLQTVGPYYKPARGGAHVITEMNKERVQVFRDLSEESAKVAALLHACDSLSFDVEENYEWFFETPLSTLELLYELKELPEGHVIVEWPEGEKFKIKQLLQVDQLRVSLTDKDHWLSISGELKVSDDKVLQMRELLALHRQAKGRFIQLDDGEFLALTEQLRRKLDALDSMSDFKENEARIPAIGSLALQDIVSDLPNLEVNAAWKKRLKHIQKVQETPIELPSTLQTELRDYQEAGFTWMARLAELGAGACLADDMGLGKTIQALALLLHKAHEGPSLVVAPTSVCFNWIREALKFAPTLKMHRFGEGNRQKQLKSLKGMDVLVCSYGLMQQEIEMIQKVSWNVVILDEAQAIKNHQTKRFKAAIALQAKFRMVATGTPIENYLGELWNLMEFINPGLLGGRETFQKVFIRPIELSNDVNRKKELRRWIQPFLLRRTKTQVLEQLPPKTEIMLDVELSDEEMSFYEAIRQEAEQSLTVLSKNSQTGHHSLQILAELMRLRRACCHPQLVDPEISLGSSKLQVLEGLLQELIENGHKALIFSQFVGYLEHVQVLLKQMRVSYNYLDGQTPSKKREAQVNEFQQGKNDVFLISLKAGGFGLNLTAADYVIHLDPWWNPAVEDQASDRAHRIGQTRPITVYRLVARHTIEEKIVKLHHQKRDLANSLLEGSDVSGKLSMKDLLKWIQEDVSA